MRQVSLRDRLGLELTGGEASQLQTGLQLHELPRNVRHVAETACRGSASERAADLALPAPARQPEIVELMPAVPSDTGSELPQILQQPVYNAASVPLVDMSVIG